MAAALLITAPILAIGCLWLVGRALVGEGL